MIRKVSPKFVVVSAILGTICVGAIPFIVVDEGSAEATVNVEASLNEVLERSRKSSERSWDEWKEQAEERLRKSEEEEKKRLAKLREDNEAKLKELRDKGLLDKSKRSRSVKRYHWESPAEARARLWNVPEEDSNEATATALLRVCISEADGNQSDCLGIWQVIKTIRSRNCARDWIRKITECDENGETYLSTLRRASKYVLGVVPPRSRRQKWISNLELDCEQPKYWPYSSDSWNKRYKNRRCPRVAKLARDLVAGKTDFDWPVRGSARPVTWGGRCESGNGACDDDLACQRGLARLYTDTLNALWCVPGHAGCSDDIDPICIKRGFPSIKERRELEEISSN